MVGALLSIMLFAVASTTAQEAKKADVPMLTELSRKIASLVQEYYPEAGLTNSERTIHFEWRARAFMVHEPLMTGDWQDARAVRGPNRGGVVCDISLHLGKYENTQWDRTAAPAGHRYWAFDKRYYQELLFIPYSSVRDCHLYVLLRIPADASPKFIERFDDLISNFEGLLKPSS